VCVCVCLCVCVYVCVRVFGRGERGAGWVYNRHTQRARLREHILIRERILVRRLEAPRMLRGITRHDTVNGL
jgi:hypothetical protein